MTDSDWDTTDSTRVDLGTDLLETTAGGTDLLREQSFILKDIKDIPDALKSAKILQDEGLLEEAKKILRKILFKDPRCIPAKKRLQEIHEIEVKQIFSDLDHSSKRSREPSIDANQVIQQLDHDLAVRGTSSRSILTPDSLTFSLFGDAQNIDAFAFRLDRELEDASTKTRMDLGIAFLEMGLYDLAIRQFRIVSQAEAVSDDASMRASALSLLAYSMILAGKSFDAIMILEPAIADHDVGPEIKVEFYYLMGRAEESLGHRENAVRWYQEVIRIDRIYRDASDRLKNCFKAGLP